ncbi:uncharacterized protein LOC127264342 [Andrographis paniculata]|uniref:uncharacterized protein LOC127264342 n=1 Tax=Andrographis paniculata TaxID=175694 RepID=UPI0021E7B700|nr:uncharacterized protein LOC127264342 [Andrographis paniculata]
MLGSPNVGLDMEIVAIESTNFIYGSNINDWERLYTSSAPAPASSGVSEGKKIRKKDLWEERKSMVENYVNRYREMNAGKFPSASNIKANVGGSYYSVRKILQEMIYHSKTPFMDTKASVSLEKGAVKKAGPGVGSREVLPRNKIEHMSPILKVDMKDDISKSVKSKDKLQSPISDQSEIAKHDGPQFQCLVNESKSSLQSDPGNSSEYKTVHEDKVNLDGLQPTAELKQSTESDVSWSESRKVPSTKAAEPPKKSSVWHNLRSFANGILGIWKRS